MNGLTSSVTTEKVRAFPCSVVAAGWEGERVSRSFQDPTLNRCCMGTAGKQ